MLYFHLPFQTVHHRMAANSLTSPTPIGPSTNWENLQSLPAARYHTISRMRYLRLGIEMQHVGKDLCNHCFPLRGREKTSSSAAQLLQVMQHPLQVGEWFGAFSREQHIRVQLQGIQEEIISLFSFAIPHTHEKVFDSSQVSFHIAVSQKMPIPTLANVDSNEKRPQLKSPNDQLRCPLCGGAAWHVEGWPPRPSTACREPIQPSTPTTYHPFLPIQAIQNLQ